MNKLIDIAYSKGFWLSSDASIYEAMACMIKNKNGSVVLLNKNKPVAIVTESSLLAKIEEGIDVTLPVISLAKSPVICTHYHRPIESAFDLVVSNNIRRLILIDDNNDYAGVVLQEDLFDYLEDDVYKVDLKVSDIISKDAMLISIYEESSLYDALHTMNKRGIGSVVIVNKEQQAVGIITEKDIISAGYQNIDMNKGVRLLMSSPVWSVQEDEAITDIIALMKDKRIRRVLVVDIHSQLRTLLTNRDIFQHIKGNVARILEIKLRHAKEIMNLLPEAIIEIFISSSQQSIEWMNSRAKLVFGEEFLSKSPQEMMGEKEWIELYDALIQKGTIEGSVVPFKDRSIEFSGTVSQNINSKYIKLIGRDITEQENIKQKLQLEVHEEVRLRRENEYLMMQQSRMASMGEMISHIAHQWRQPLAQLGGIFMNLQASYAFDELNQKTLDESVDDGNEMIKYMSQTIDDFRLFFAHDRVKESFDLLEYVHRATQIVLTSLDYHHIDVVIESSDSSYMGEGYPNEFAQAILNLLNNSMDALSSLAQIDKKIIIKLSHQDENAVISFCDNGAGISEDILSRIFEPYITTKQEEGGTGVGLYITRLIIEQKMLGEIRAYNNGSGACFEIKLPNF